MNQIMIPKFELSKIKHPSTINIIGRCKTGRTTIAREIIKKLSPLQEVIIFTNQPEDYKELYNTTIYNDTLFLNKIIKKCITSSTILNGGFFIIFDQIPSLYTNYYIIPKLLKLSKSCNITTIIIDQITKFKQINHD